MFLCNWKKPNHEENNGRAHRSPVISTKVGAADSDALSLPQKGGPPVSCWGRPMASCLGGFLELTSGMPTPATLPRCTQWPRKGTVWPSLGWNQFVPAFYLKFLFDLKSQGCLLKLWALWRVRIGWDRLLMMRVEMKRKRGNKTRLIVNRH